MVDEGGQTCGPGPVVLRITRRVADIGVLRALRRIR
jgi:hypothetical protein